MAPAAASILSSATSAVASKRPAASDAEPPIESKQPRQPQQQLECPRCQSTNTKFCYYNNYSTAQPRHFCRACRRYWTHGGTLRDVPVGGASRRSGGKRRRVSATDQPSPSSASASSPPQPTAGADGSCLMLPDLSAFPFLSDGSFLPQLDDLLGAAPAAFSSWHSVVPDFFDGLAPWDDGTVPATSGVTVGAWADVAAGLELSWPPPGI